MRTLRNGFNEAPAKRGGDWLSWFIRLLQGKCFNEAPAKRGGDSASTCLSTAMLYRLQ